MNILDFVFPKDLYCISCGRPLPPQGAGGLALCDRCVSEISWISGGSCEKCGRLLADENPGRFCRECEDDGGHMFRRGYACAVYTGRAADIVREMKYRRKSWYADTLASLMAAKYFSGADPETGELPEYDGLAFVPMSARKMAARGYDQAGLIARGLSRKTGIPFLPGALERVRETDVMSGLSAGERRQNLAGAFVVPCDMIDIVAGKKLLIVDDVYTTGSSVGVCAEALLAAGAESVDVLVFAIGADARPAKSNAEMRQTEEVAEPRLFGACQGAPERAEARVLQVRKQEPRGATWQVAKKTSKWWV